MFSLFVDGEQEWKETKYFRNCIFFPSVIFISFFYLYILFHFYFLMAGLSMPFTSLFSSLSFILETSYLLSQLQHLYPREGKKQLWNFNFSES